MCTFRKLSKTGINLLIGARQEWFFSASIHMNFLCLRYPFEKKGSRELLQLYILLINT